MPRRYRQFLGSKPGIVVELVDDSSSPYRVRTEDGFEFSISTEDFNNYYKEDGAPTPLRWSHLITEPADQAVDSRKMVEVMRIIHLFDSDFNDFNRARTFVRDVVSAVERDPRPNLKSVRESLKQSPWNPDILTERRLKELQRIDSAVKELLLSDSCAVIPFLDSLGDNNGEETLSAAAGGADQQGKSGAKKAATPKKKRAQAKGIRGGTENLHLAVSGDTLTVTVDLSKEYGPSKSGKTTIVASTLGNKPIPGRDEFIGLNIYKQETKKRLIGRQDSFKNMVMAVDGDMLTITIDLSQEFGPSKSGRTTIIASSEGNRLVYERSEKIGLNVYRKLE